MSEMAVPRESLASILALERSADGGLLARLEDFFGESQCGDLLARAALAAAATSPERELHSLRASFLRPAPPGRPLELRVASLQDDADEAHRAIEVRDGAPLARVELRFAAPGGGLGFQHVAPPPEVPAPESLPSSAETARAEGWPEVYARGPLEFRRVGPLWPEGERRAHVTWLRPRAPLPDDPRLHESALAFVSGFYPHWEFERRIGPGFDYPRFRKLDHALWIHRSARFDDWWLLVAASDVAASGLALARRSIFDRSGRLLASAAGAARVAAG